MPGEIHGFKNRRRRVRQLRSASGGPVHDQPRLYGDEHLAKPATTSGGSGHLTVRGDRLHSIMWFTARLANALALGGCATGACHPVTVVVADKEERSRLEMMPRGFRTGATGQLEELREPVTVREYWVRSEQGAWL